MRIALDATYSLGDNLSGVGIYCRETLAGLARAHPEARFDCCYRPHRWLRSWTTPLPPNCRRRLLHEPLVPRAADVFHGLNQRLPAVRLRRAVTTFHDLFVLTGEYSTPEFRQRFQQQARHAAANSALIVTVSEFTARQVERLLGVERARLRVIHHGVRLYPDDSGAARENLVLHVGALQRRKNITRLVEAFARLGPDWRLALAGSPGFGAEEILRHIEASPARDRIQVLGYVSESTLRHLYGRARILAFASLDEGFGMPVLEAMAQGVAVVTSNRSALPEVAGDAALLVDPHDAEALGAALHALATQEDVRRDFIARGRRRAAAFSWDTAVARTWAVYQELMRGV
ncbi:MAG: glycosyltransferase family 4 protein [Acidobacteria bacterium]|nr:glycosyltransferase family 4 protein [Acidobacteriota bacterium]